MFLLNFLNGGNSHVPIYATIWLVRTAAVVPVVMLSMAMVTNVRTSMNVWQNRTIVQVAFLARTSMVDTNVASSVNLERH